MAIVLVGRAARAARAAGSVAALTAAFGLFGCESLPPLAQGVCGNSVVDPGEACDTFAAEGLTCGAPGSPGACRYVCELRDDGTSSGCPSGQGCGLDAICRQASGAFGKPTVWGGGAQELSLGDLDGDGRADLVSIQAQAVQLLFGAGEGEQPVTIEQSLEPLLAPVLAPWRPGRGSDLLVSRSGLVSLRALGQGADRHLDAAEQPFVRAPKALSDSMPASSECAHESLRGGMVMHATIDAAPLPTFHALLYSPQFSMQVLGPTLQGPSALAGPIVVGQFDERPESPCKELVLGYKGESQVEIFDPFRVDPLGNWRTVTCPYPFLSCPDDSPRRLQVGAPVLRGPFAGQLNPEDDHLDLVVQVKAPDTASCTPCYELRAAYGVGDGTFHSDPHNVPLQGGDNTFSVIPLGDDSNELLLAVGDLDGDGLADFVRERSVRRNYVPDTRLLANVAAPWTEAIVADFNGNGFMDLLAVDGQSSQAFFYSGTADGLLTAFAIPTPGPLSQLRGGDFDGDTLADAVAVIHEAQSDSQGPTPVDEVSVLFGRPDATPAAPVSIGRSSQDQRLAVGKMAGDIMTTFGGLLDGATDILAVGANEGGARTISAFVGRGDRELRAPLGLLQTQELAALDVVLHPYLPRRPVTGLFSPDDAPTASNRSWRVATLALPGTKADVAKDYQLWLAPELGTTIDISALTLVPEPIQLGTSTAALAVWELGMYEAIDLDGDGLDELVAVAPLVADGQKSAYRIGHYDVAADGWRWLPEDDVGTLDLPLYRYAGPSVPCRDPYGFPDPSPTACQDMDLARLTTTEFDFPLVNGRMRVCSYRADGPAQTELVVLSRPALRSDDPAESTVQATLRVYAPNGSLSLSSDDFQLVQGLEQHRLRDFACLQADADPEPEFVVLADDGLWLVNGSVDSPTVTSIPIAEAETYKRIAVGDVDGDGLDDIVLASETATIVLRGADNLVAQASAP